jgi:hypothetical protein
VHAPVAQCTLYPLQGLDAGSLNDGIRLQRDGIMVVLYDCGNLWVKKGPRPWWDLGGHCEWGVGAGGSAFGGGTG